MQSCKSEKECNEHNLFTWISAFTTILGIVTSVYSMIKLNNMDTADEKTHRKHSSENNGTHIDSLVIHFVVAAFVGIIQTSFSILPVCKILCRSTWKWVNFVGGCVLLINATIYISNNLAYIHDMEFWIWNCFDGFTLIVLTLSLCCRDYRLNQSMDLSRSSAYMEHEVA